VVFALVVTAALPFLGYSIEPNTKFGAFYASWVAGVFLFTTAGFFVAVASVVRPHEDWFEARARNLFRRASGRRIDYIIERLRALEHYSEHTTVKTTVKEYAESDGRKVYFVEDYDSMVIKSFIDDIDTSVESRYHLSDISIPPAGDDRKNCLVYVKVNGAPTIADEFFEREIDHPYTVPIDRHSSGVVETAAHLWIDADSEVSAHEPVRFTERLTVDVENLVRQDQPVKVRLTDANKQSQEFVIKGGETLRVYSAQDVRPGSVAYDLRILAP
jgi:hypothetical protein